MTQEAGSLDPFAIVFDLKGSALQGLREMGYALKEIIGLQRTCIDNFSKMNMDPNMYKPLRGVNNELDNMKDNSRDSLLQLKEFGDMLASTFEAAMNKIIEIGSEAINVASEVESSRKKLAFSAAKAGVDAEKQAKQIEDAGLKTVQTTKSLYDMASTLNMQKINLFDDTLNDLKYVNKAGQEIKLTSAEVLADAASLSARGPEAFMNGLRAALGDGKIKRNIGLDAILDLPEEFRTRYNKALASGSTQQEKFNNLVRELGKDFGGTASSLGDSFKFMSAQVDDFRDKIYYELMKDVLPKLTQMIKEAGEYVVKLLDSGKLDPIRKTLTEIFDVGIKVVKFLGRMVGYMIDVVAAHPGLLKVGMAILTIGLASQATFALLSRLGVMVQGLVILFETMGKAMAWMKGGGLMKMLAPFAPILLKLGLIAAAVALLARIMVKGTSWADTWERVQLIFEAISEGITNMKDGVTSMSAETALKLKQSGLFEFVYNFLRISNRIGKFLGAMYDSIEKHGPKIWENIVRIRNAISSAIDRILSLAGVVVEGFATDLSSAADTSVESWVNFGDKIGTLIGVLIEGFTSFLVMVYETADAVMGIVDPIIDKLKTAYSIYRVVSGKALMEHLTGSGEEEAAPSEYKLKALALKHGYAKDERRLQDPMGFNGKADIEELKNVIARGQPKQAPSPDYKQIKQAIIDGMKEGKPPDITLNGKKVTDEIGNEVGRRKALAQ